MAGDQERLARLAKKAQGLTHLPVADQFRALARDGLTLTDVNWENCNTQPGVKTVIPVKAAELTRQG